MYCAGLGLQELAACLPACLPPALPPACPDHEKVGGIYDRLRGLPAGIL